MIFRILYSSLLQELVYSKVNWKLEYSSQFNLTDPMFSKSQTWFQKSNAKAFLCSNCCNCTGLIYAVWCSHHERMKSLFSSWHRYDPLNYNWLWILDYINWKLLNQSFSLFHGGPIVQIVCNISLHSAFKVFNYNILSKIQNKYILSYIFNWICRHFHEIYPIRNMTLASSQN